MSKLVGIQQLRAAPSRIREQVANYAPRARGDGLLPRIRGAVALGRTAVAHTRDMLYPLVLIIRGAGRGAARVVAWWRNTHADKRTAVAFLVATCGFLVYMLPWGPVLVTGCLMALAAYLGRDPKVATLTADGEPAGDDKRLQSLYNGLVPYLMDDHDPEGLFRPGGSYTQAFSSWETGRDGSLRRLELRYSPFFRDGDAEARRQVERALAGKLGKSSEFTCEWDEQANKLGVTVLPPLPGGIVAQSWPVAEIEYVLGFTDEAATSRQIPVEIDGGTRHLVPVVWRVGASSAQAHLVVAGAPGSGRSNLLRTLAAQAAMCGGYLLLLDGRGDGLGHSVPGGSRAGRAEHTPHGVADALAWAATEVERRHHGLLRSRKEGAAPTEDLRRQLWVMVDDLPDACDAASAFGLPDPREALAKILRQGRLAHVTVVLGLCASRLDMLDTAMLNLARARVGLGRLEGQESRDLFSSPLTVEGIGPMPSGRGYARLGSGDIVRLQVPLMPEHGFEDPDTLGLPVAAEPGATEAPIHVGADIGAAAPVPAVSESAGPGQPAAAG